MSLGSTPATLPTRTSAALHSAAPPPPELTASEFNSFLRMLEQEVLDAVARTRLPRFMQRGRLIFEIQEGAVSPRVKCEFESVLKNSS